MVNKIRRKGRIIIRQPRDKHEVEVLPCVQEHVLKFGVLQNSIFGVHATHMSDKTRTYGDCLRPKPSA